MDFGLDLLMNQNKKSSDVQSVRSSRSGSIKVVERGGGGNHYDGDSEISIPIIKNVGPPSEIDVQSLMERVNNDDETSSGEYETESYQSERMQDSRPNKPYKNYDTASVQSLGSLLVRTKESRPQSIPRMSEEDILNAKRELLYQFDRIEKKGYKLPRKFTMASNLDEMKVEYERLKRDREVDNAIKFQRKCVMMFSSGLEFMNSKFDPFDIKLDGWSESVHENIDDYDDIFEELYDKYKGKAKMAPELRLLMTLGGSAFMFHMTNSMFKNTGIDQVLKQNPGLMKQFAAATANTMKNNADNNPGGGGILGGLAGLFGNMFSGGQDQGMPQASMAQQAQAQAQQMSQPPKFNMKGPSNIDHLMKELEKNNNNDRIEVMSTVTSSEFTELQDDMSINNLIYNKKGKRSQKANTMSLDI